MDTTDAVKRGIHAILPKCDAELAKSPSTPNQESGAESEEKIYVRTVQFMLRLNEDLRDQIKLEALKVKKDMNRYLLEIIQKRHQLI